MNEPKPFKIKYEVYPEGDLFVARCLNIDVASDGATEEEALDNLREAIELFFERNAEAAISAAEAQGEDDEEDEDGEEAEEDR